MMLVTITVAVQILFVSGIGGEQCITWTTWDTYLHTAQLLTCVA